LDWDNNDYCLAYNVFQDFKRISIKTDSLLYVDIIDFKNKYPKHSVDSSDQLQIVSGVKSNITIHVDFNKSISAPSGTDEGTICYIVVVSKYLLPYEQAKNDIVKNFKYFRVILLYSLRL
jgi:hypothetical protein